jgi:hypothetical protein
MYFNIYDTGIFLSVKNSKCTYHDMQLEEIRKYIIHDVHQRPLCRTMMTVSIDTTQCMDTIAEVEHLCKQPKSIYFQGKSYCRYFVTAEIHAV